MKKVYLFLLPLFLMILFVSFTINSDVISKIGCTIEEADNTIFDNLFFGNYNAPYCNNKYKTIPINEKEIIVNQLYAYVKSLVSSEKFISKYKLEHENAKPIEPKIEIKPKYDEQTAQLFKGMEDELNNPNLTEEQKTELKKNIEIMKQTYSNPEYKKMLEQANDAEKQQSINDYNISIEKYKLDLLEWEKTKNLNVVIKERLNNFIELTSNINFDAKLVKINDKFKFENPEYESKSSDWKKCFRAGKETINAARKCAIDWLKEL